MNYRRAIILGTVAALPLLMTTPIAHANDTTVCSSFIVGGCDPGLAPTGDTAIIVGDPLDPVQAGVYPGDGQPAPVTVDDTDPFDPTSTKADVVCTWDSEQDGSTGLVPDGITRLPGGFFSIKWLKVKTQTYIIYKHCWRKISPTTTHHWYNPKTVYFLFRSDEDDVTGHTKRFECGLADVLGFDHFQVDAFIKDGTGETVNPDPFNVPCVRDSYGNSISNNINPNHKRLVYRGDFPTWQATVKDVNDNMPDRWFDTAHGYLNPFA